jgi:hypothetical protein
MCIAVSKYQDQSVEETRNAYTILMQDSQERVILGRYRLFFFFFFFLLLLLRSTFESWSAPRLKLILKEQNVTSKPD